ncbi:hypothetical protein ACFL2Y_02115 [Candidatus Omnitrophota bacterium]
MAKENSLLKVALRLSVIFLLVIFLSSCSQETEVVPISKSAPLTFSGVWAKSFFPGQLEAHYLKHRHEFGDITKEEYLNNARALLNSPAGKDVLEKRRENQDVLHYRVSTGEFAVMTGGGRIRTYFKTNYRYWLRQ